ncbi:polyphosphate kinase 2 [Amaricoccus sp.]|uniref:polyphosphate kinase 2 n=1 Tax=Amaricoccus sp. TaxID=1872485 RepID=UPI001B3D9021|nr:polyphosphate kinase 2 [Amaricoccus sp.]MBP7000957.1 polyphosphate kinase 2 [Amaricoccus sp.]
MAKKRRGDAPAAGEVRENVIENVAAEAAWRLPAPGGRKPKGGSQGYIRELVRLQFELLKLQDWVKRERLRVVVVFEGRDAAGKGGVIKRISESLNPRHCRIVALASPTERERGQWYFQRYVAHLPAAGEIVLFDRSWYNRAGVEKVMGFCTTAEHAEFLRAAPLFEEMLIRSGVILIKYWFSVSDAEQERRFQDRIRNPIKRWKLSPMDVKSRARWVDYSRAKDEMFAATDTDLSPWHVVDADNKKRARLNCIAHLLRQIPYREIAPAKVRLAPRQKDDGYVRPAKDSQRWVEAVY